MYCRKFVLLAIGVITALFILIYMIVSMALGNKGLLIPAIVVAAYIVYIFPTIIEEYKSYKRDKESGLQEAVMKLYDVKIFSKSVRDGQPALPMVTFKGKDVNDYITLSGDFSKVKLIEGKKYKIVFYKNSRMLVDIKAL